MGILLKRIGSKLVNISQIVSIESDERDNGKVYCIFKYSNGDFTELVFDSKIDYKNYVKDLVFAGEAGIFKLLYNLYVKLKTKQKV